MPQNRLAQTSSPYLLQHAQNPVDWWPWSDEAFAEAVRRDVPVFLSVGYSTCYWCHVMERETFENERLASIMNEHLVCIKVDREERPDVDDVYMNAVQALTGSGGWPMSVFLDPETRMPYWGGTYFPPEPRYGRQGFDQIVEAMHRVWTTRKDEAKAQSLTLANEVRSRLSESGAPVVVGATEVTAGISALLSAFDRVHGGFGGAPKFPQPAYMDFMMDAITRAGDDATRQSLEGAVRHTLDRMLAGGIHDHVGGGFHRYAVDGTWTVPHFEKMLYDNAALAFSYANASELFDDSEYARVAQRTCEYVLREMTEPAGGFRSAQDAEVDAREGLSYLWTLSEFEETLGAEDAAWAGAVFGVTGGKNFQDPHHPDDAPSNVLRLSDRTDAIGIAEGSSAEAFRERLDRVCGALLVARDARKQPGLDDKVIASWNGLMIRGLARAGAVLGRVDFLDAAERAAAFVRESMVVHGRLVRSWRGGRVSGDAFLEDHAMLAWGLCELVRAQRRSDRDEAETLSFCRWLCDEAIERFADTESGRLYDVDADKTDLFVRSSSVYDGAMVSASSAMIAALSDLAELVGDEKYLRAAVSAIAGVSSTLASSPVGCVETARTLLALMGRGHDVESLLQSAGAQPRASAAGEDQASPVQVFASVDRVTVGDEPAELSLAITIEKGYHIIAAEPGVEGVSLMPLRVLVAGAKGIEAYADYPAGEPLELGGDNEALGTLLVHSEQVELRVAIAKLGGEVEGRPLLVVSFQACSDTECLAPATFELDVAIDIE